MPQFKEPRLGEVSIDLPDAFDAHLYFIGRIRTPWKTTAECPKNSRGRADVTATIEINEPYRAGLRDLGLFSHAIALYWLDLSRRDLIEQMPSHLTSPRGVFALRSPVRPNPIGMAVIEIISVQEYEVKIRNIDCVDGTPLIDLKPYFASIDAVPGAIRP